jgi:hypothetical protein
MKIFSKKNFLLKVDSSFLFKGFLNLMIIFSNQPTTKFKMDTVSTHKRCIIFPSVECAEKVSDDITQ